MTGHLSLSLKKLGFSDKLLQTQRFSCSKEQVDPVPVGLENSYFRDIPRIAAIINESGFAG